MKLDQLATSCRLATIPVAKALFKTLDVTGDTFDFRFIHNALPKRLGRAQLSPRLSQEGKK